MARAMGGLLVEIDAETDGREAGRSLVRSDLKGALAR